MEVLLTFIFKLIIITIFISLKFRTFNNRYFVPLSMQQIIIIITKIYLKLRF